MTGRIILAGRSSVPTSDIDAMTLELYGFCKNLVSTDAGNVGIGRTPSASTKLDVAGGARAQEVLLENASSSGSLGTSPGLYSPASGELAMSSNSAERLRITSSGHVRPGADNTQDNGHPSFRWAVVRAGTSTINTSDAREKTAVRALTSAELAAGLDLADEGGAFKFLSAIAEKGEAAARWHIGMTVQRAIEIMESHGLDPFAYGFICFDSWEADGGRAAGNRYGFRESELHRFILKAMRAEQLNILARLAALEAA